MRKALTTKLLRDMRMSGMQFFALILLCVLGTFLFTGIDSIANTIQLTNETYFDANNMADLWITLPSADREALERVRSIPGVDDACARFSMDMDTTLPTAPLVSVTGYDGAMDINQPLLREGERLDPSDRRGCLVQTSFADVYGLQVGDAITVEQGDAAYTYFVRGIVYSPEYASVSSTGDASDPSKYGFLLVNAASMPEVPLTQIVATLDGAASLEAVKQAVRAQLPRALIIDRASHRSTVTVVENVKMFRNVSLVFPVAAFLVAALIVMVTLTRMIENQRMQIGTLKSLGYSQAQIRRHFLSFAAWPSLIGAVLGAIIGHLTLPLLIWNLMMSQYEYPYRMQPPISPVAWGLVAFTVVMSVVICLWTYRKVTRETTAALLRPKMPKSGERVFLERISSVWGRLRFNTKMVVRNIMRSKMRTIMSCVGILCCNALIIASMGLQDSVARTADDYYDRALGYDVLVTLDSRAGDVSAYRERLDADGVEGIMETSVRVFTDTGERVTNLTVVEDGQRMLHLGVDESHVPLVSGAAVITDKLATTLSLSPGDAFSIQLTGDKETLTATVGQVVYNDFSQGLYMTQSTWEGLRKGPFVPTALQLRAPSAASLAALDGMDEVVKIETSAERKAETLKAVDLMSTVFVILLIIALALAFVICYNMGLINFMERMREYATLQVLGYHKKEIRKLIISENILTTAFSILLSILPGIGFTSLILAVVETETSAYTASVTLPSILLSCAITFLFSYFIQLMLARKVQGIDMVDALKSVE